MEQLPWELTLSPRIARAKSEWLMMIPKEINFRADRTANDMISWSF